MDKYWINIERMRRSLLKKFGKVVVCDYIANGEALCIFIDDFTGTWHDTNELMQRILKHTQEGYPLIDKIHSEKGMFHLILKSKGVGIVGTYEQFIYTNS